MASTGDGERPMRGHVRVRGGRGPTAPRDPRPWRRTRQGLAWWPEAAGLNVAAELVPGPAPWVGGAGEVARTPNDGGPAVREAFAHAPCAMAPDVAPRRHGASVGKDGEEPPGPYAGAALCRLDGEGEVPGGRTAEPGGRSPADVAFLDEEPPDDIGLQDEPSD